MIVAILFLIVLILLFGAAAVRGWLTRGAVTVLVLLALLLIAGSIKACSDQAETEKGVKEASAELKAQAKAQTLAMISKAVGKPERDLQITVLHSSYENYVMCGEIAGTSGFGGKDGRQRFLTNGGGIMLIEPEGDRTEYDRKATELCVPGFDNEI